MIEYSQPVLYSDFLGKGGIIHAVAVKGIAELRLILRNAREAAGSPKPRCENSPGLTSARPGASGPLRRHVHPQHRAALRPARGPPRCKPPSPTCGSCHATGRRPDPDTLTEVAWSALHGIATSPARRLRPDYHQARLTMLVDQLAGVPADITPDLRPRNLPICPAAAANGVDAVPKPRALHADADFDDYPAYHSGKHTAPTRPATAAT